MALEVFYDSDTDIPEALREHYTQGDDGKFKLALNVDYKTADEINGLSTALGKEREARAAAERAAKQFEGLDPAEARKALERLKSLDVDKAKDAESITKMIQDAVAPVQQERDALAQKYQETIASYNETTKKSAFANSPVIREQVRLSPERLYAIFKEDVDIVDGGKVVFKDIYGVNGQHEEFDAAFMRKLKTLPDGDEFLKPAPGGPGTQPGTIPRTGAPKSLAECKTESDKVAYLQSLK